MTTQTTTSKIRAEVKSNYFFLRNLECKGGVIDALLNEKTSIKVSEVLAKVTTEDFAQVWTILNTVKGLKLQYSNN